LFVGNARINSPQLKCLLSVEKGHFLLEINDDIEACLLLQIVNNLLGLVGMFNIIAELLKVLLESLEFLLIIDQCLIALLLGSFVVIATG
jgi:hypothetical protein